MNPQPPLGTLGRYQLLKTLGRGAMGIVYEGLDPKLNRQVAIKTILKNQMTDPEMAREYSARFMIEAQAIARLNHPNIVTVFDFGNEADVAYLVLEFIRGRELKELIDARHVFGIAEAVGIVCELLEDLDYAHANGVVHRDIKPANVMIDAAGRVKLTDFGVARLSDGAGQDRTKAGTMIGTPGYMAPEQVQGLPAGPTVDLFATGVVLYQCLTLQKPFAGDTEWAIFHKIVNIDPPPLANYRDGIPPGIQAVLACALEKDPRNRYRSAREMIDALKAAISERVFDPDGTLFEPREDLEKTRFEPRTVPGFFQTGQTPPLPPQASATRPSAAPPSAAPVATAATLPPAPAAGGIQTSEVELEFWRTIKDGGDADEFELYLEKFPGGVYADLAKRKIAKIRGGATSATRPPPPPAPMDEATRRTEEENKRKALEAERRAAAEDAERKAEEESQRRYREMLRWHDGLS